ncbi:MAG: haloacid dehalogenase-like hydrolase [Arenimonas sp.]
MPTNKLETDIVVYDMDGTLFRGDCGGAFIKQRIKANLWRLLLSAVIAPVAFPMLSIPSIRKFGVSAYLWIASVGISEENYKKILADFIAQYRIRPIEPVLSECRKDIAEGRNVVIATGAGHEMASAFIRHLGIESQVGLVASQSSRFLGGRISSVQCNGKTKLRELIKYGYHPPYLRVYSDTASDWPILQSGITAHLVNYREKDRQYLSRLLGDKLQLIQQADS